MKKKSWWLVAVSFAVPSFSLSLHAVEPLSVITLPMERLLSQAADNLDPSEVNTASPPNILFILSDDQGWAQMSVAMDPTNVPQAASSYLETPHMAALAAAGMWFSDGYSSCSNLHAHTPSGALWNECCTEWLRVRES